MVTHSSPLHLSLVAQENKYKLVKDYNVVSKIANKTYDIWVPEGFEYDGASIPAFFWQMIYSPFAPDVMRAALVHDWLYYTHRVQKESITREMSDIIFKEIIDDDGVNIEKSNLMYQALRAAGQAAWKNTVEQNAYLKNFRTKKGAEAWKFGL